MASIQTNAAGAPTATVIVSTISVAPQPAGGVVATPAVIGYNPACTTNGCAAPPSESSWTVYNVRNTTDVLLS